MEKYYVGLDMGTNSVGWAVTDPEYHLLRAKGKDLWGARLFDEAKTAADRRTKRVARRRREREVARIGLLKEYFADSILSVDENFYIRLEESKYFIEDRSANNYQPNGFFNDPNYTDKDYFKAYPTIFHLRKELMESSEPHDVRLVFLALLNMFKHRGHFLNATLSIDSEIKSTSEAYLELQNIAEEFSIFLPAEIDHTEFDTVLTEKISRTSTLEKLSTLLDISKKNKPEYELLKAVCGLKIKIGNIYDTPIINDEAKAETFAFSDTDWEEKELHLQEVLGDEFFMLLSAAKEVYDSAFLLGLLNGEKYLSVARVKSYNEHKQDLDLLKKIYKVYLPDRYASMFRKLNENTSNYSSYVGSVNSYGKIKRRNNGKNRDIVGLEKQIMKDFSKLSDEAGKDPNIALVREKIAASSFLPKQLTFANGSIPNQLHAREMKVILQNASTYLSFLNDVDESGLAVKDRILQLFRFQIPYYVGPLGQEYLDKKGYNVWAERIAPGRIYPWNFEEKIDVRGAAEKFIERMVGHCTYITGEHALPKSSLMYERFMVLNELNNLKIYGEKVTVEQKQNIYNDLFASGKKVTRKKLTSYLVANGLLENEDASAITGIDEEIHSSLSTLGKFKKILGDGIDSDIDRKMLENIVFWSTIYGNDKKFLKQRITENYGNRLDELQIKKIVGLKFTGWGRLSNAFLEISGASDDGIERSLLSAMWETNHNLMELLADQYTYIKNLEKITVKSHKLISEWVPEDLDDLYLSPPVKRMVWQTLKIMQELRGIMSGDPARIFVEMPRDATNEQKGKRTISRKNKLLDLYKSLGKEDQL